MSLFLILRTLSTAPTLFAHVITGGMLLGFLVKLNSLVLTLLGWVSSAPDVVFDSETEEFADLGHDVSDSVVDSASNADFDSETEDLADVGQDVSDELADLGQDVVVSLDNSAQMFGEAELTCSHIDVIVESAVRERLCESAPDDVSDSETDELADLGQDVSDVVVSPDFFADLGQDVVGLLRPLA